MILRLPYASVKKIATFYLCSDFGWQGRWLSCILKLRDKRTKVTDSFAV